MPSQITSEISKFEWMELMTIIQSHEMLITLQLRKCETLSTGSEENIMQAQIPEFKRC